MMMITICVLAAYGLREAIAESCKLRNAPQQEIGRLAVLRQRGREASRAGDERSICERKNYTEHRGSYAYVNSLVG
jgi:hypothetical protein